jgi:nucleoside-diphosphate-sugar epimerase
VRRVLAKATEIHEKIIMAVRYLITGATGFVGGHVAEACVARRYAVSTIARQSSDTALLDRLGTTIYRGDLTDPEVVRKAVQDAEVIVHCAAKVGDWGPIEDYRKVNVEALRLLLEASKGQGLERFVHVSSLGVYPLRHHHGTDESYPLPARHKDAYTQTKVEAEQLALRYHRDFGVPVAVLRPGFVYGPRDRLVMPKIIENLRNGQLRYLGNNGQNALNAIYVENLVEAVFLAVDNPSSVGEVFNLGDGESVSKRRFIEAIASALKVPPPQRALKLWQARVLCFLMEGTARLRRAKEAPRLTQAKLKFLGMNLDFSIDKAKRVLGYRPRVGFERGMQETMAWYHQNS